MKIDLCKIFGVEEGEEFKLGNGLYKNLVYKVSNNILWSRCEDGKVTRSSLYINELLNVKEIIKLPKKKEFTDDELCILRNVDKEYEWIARDDDGKLYLYKKKTVKSEELKGKWVGSEWSDFNVYDHLFQSIQWTDNEPVFIDDYVER